MSVTDNMWCGDPKCDEHPHGDPQHNTPVSLHTISHDRLDDPCVECGHRAGMHAGRGCCQTTWDENHPVRGVGCACTRSARTALPCRQFYPPSMDNNPV